jgi:hypothetical protein
VIGGTVSVPCVGGASIGGASLGVSIGGVCVGAAAGGGAFCASTVRAQSDAANA